MPTVATRNGGPVDIMKTLHHGVVVDPTDEAAVAEALLDILTHPSKWEEMSKNGACPGEKAQTLDPMLETPPGATRPVTFSLCEVLAHPSKVCFTELRRP